MCPSGAGQGSRGDRQATCLVTIAAILATIGTLTHERATGTLAWTLSKPVSRSSVLLAKWAASVVALSVCAVILPLVIASGVATVAYGGLPDLAVVSRYGLVLLGVPAFIVALNLAVATRLGSQAGITAIALAVFAVPFVFGGFLPLVAELWPTAIGAMAGIVATGTPANAPTVAAWAIGVVAVGLVGLYAFNREDL